MSKARDLAEAALDLIREINPAFGVDAHPASRTVDHVRQLANDVLYDRAAPLNDQQRGKP